MVRKTRAGFRKNKRANGAESRMQPSSLFRLFRALAPAACLGLSMLPIAPARAQAPAPTPGATAGNPVPMPGFWDPRRRPERPDLSRVTLIRFLTENDFPPFN